MGKRAAACVLGLILCVAGALPASSACTDSTLTLRGDWGTARFSVEVADDADERSQGLMFREAMPKFAGMLFVYDRPQQVAFWMRNTLIPLDMLFAGADGVVTRVHANAVPGDETSIPGGGAVQYVLEINGGLAATLGIAPGTQMQHPSIGPEQAAWPCP